MYTLLSFPLWHAHDFDSNRISVEGLEDEVRQVSIGIKALDSQLNEDEHGIRSYFKGKFTTLQWA
jgi:hypothetical protein